MSASTKAKQEGLKSLSQVIQMTGVARSTLEDWAENRTNLFNIILFGCKKALGSIPAGWAYECNTDSKWPRHCFIHDDYTPADDDRDSEHFIDGYDFIQTLADVLAQEEHWEYMRGTK